ncbi:hypothetical protein MY1884_009511 [Beauveria asiatica]
MQFLPLFLASASLAAAHQQPNAVTVTKYLPFEQHPCYAYLTLGGEGDFSAAACRPGACCIGVQDVDTKTGHGGKYVGPGGHPLILASHPESSAQGSSGGSVVSKNSFACGGSKPITSGSVVAVLSSHGGLIIKPLVEIKTGDWAVAEESYATTAVTVPETPRETVVVTTMVSKVLTYTTTFSGTPIVKSSMSVAINTKTFTAPAAIPTLTTLTTPVMIPATKVITADNSTITSLVTTTSEKVVTSIRPVLTTVTVSESWATLVEVTPAKLFTINNSTITSATITSKKTVSKSTIKETFITPVIVASTKVVTTTNFTIISPTIITSKKTVTNSTTIQTPITPAIITSTKVITINNSTIMSPTTITSKDTVTNSTTTQTSITPVIITSWAIITIRSSTESSTTTTSREAVTSVQPIFTNSTTAEIISPATSISTLAFIPSNSTTISLVTTTSKETVASVQPVLINSTTTSEETVSIQTIPTNSSTTSKETVIQPIPINSTTTSTGTITVSSLPIFINSTTASAVSALTILANSTTTSKETVAVSALPILANSTTTSYKIHLYDSYYNKQLNHYGDNNANYQYLYVSHCNEQLNYGDEDTKIMTLVTGNSTTTVIISPVTITSMAAIITNNSTSASLTTITKSIITPSVVVTTNSSTIIEPIASLIPPPPRTTKSRVIPSSCPTPTCSPGIQYALYDNPFRRDLSPTYKSFSPAYFRKTKPVYSTTLQNAIYITDRYRGRGKGFNPLFKNAAAGYRGFLFACQDGRYRFNSPYSDDITIMWFGDKAYQNYTRGNADIIQFFYGDNRPKNIYRDLKAGTYYPIRVLWGNTGGASDLSLRIYGPNGEDVSGADQSGEHFLTTEACDGSYPPFRPWGKENRNRHKKGKKEVE